MTWGPVDCNRRICWDIPPPSRGIFVNVIRSVSEPYIRGVMPSLIKVERAFIVFTYCWAYCSLLFPLSLHRVRRFPFHCTAGECGEHFPNTVVPCYYLGLPLSTKKIPKAHYESVIEAIARKLPPCHGALMAQSSRLVWIKSVLRSILIYAMIPENLPPWVRKEIDNICRKFF